MSLRMLLNVVVFFTGASVLVIEVLATRILAPYYGNTSYTISSIIGICLAALSAGYYVGGALSERKGNLSNFFTIIILSGFSVFIAKFINSFFIYFLSFRIPFFIGPILVSAILFFFPFFLLGMLSPFSIRLQTTLNKDVGVGKLSGEVFFFSTLGSITGSILTGFLFIPYFGIDVILSLTSLFLLLIGLVGRIVFRKGDFPVFTIFSVLILSLYVWFLKPFKDPSIIFQKDGEYRKIVIRETKDKNSRLVRSLIQDTNYSAASYVNSSSLVFEYTKYYKLYELFFKDLKRVLCLGGGGYSVPMAFIESDSKVIVDVSEIEKDLVEISKKYFHLSDSSRINHFFMDARRFLRETKNKYDIIFTDTFISHSPPFHLATKEFFELSKSKLKENGIFIINVVGRVNSDNSLVFSLLKTIRSIFSNLYLFSVDSNESQKVQNVIILAINGDRKIDFKSKEVVNNDEKIIQTLEQHNFDISRVDFSKYVLLTDNYAPVGFLARDIR